MLFLILIALAIPGTHNQSPAKASTDDHAIVTPRRIERTIGRGEDRQTTVMIRPVVKGLPEPFLKRIRKEFELKKVLGQYYEFYKDHELFGLDYRVTYNQHYILAITFSWNAYFAEHRKGMTFDLRNGSLIKPQDLFRDDEVAGLVKLIDQKLQAELEQILHDYKGPLDLNYLLKDLAPPLRGTFDDLVEFALNDKGITFFYYAGYHHTLARFEPKGRYFFKYSEIKSFLKPNSVVWQFVQ